MNSHTNMNTMGGISTDPTLLDVELPRTLIESPSVSTFLPEEEASICPLLSTNTNGSTTPLTFSHPLTPSMNGGVDSDLHGSVINDDDDDGKAESSSISGSSSGIGMDVNDTTAKALFNKHSYQHLQNNNNGNIQDTNGHGLNGNLKLSENTPSFVSWNWPLIRKCTFFIFVASLFAMCAIVVAMIITLPKTCNPKTAWYRGGVFYEIFPASFQDSNNDGVGDIRGIGKRVSYLSALNIAAIRLNSIFPSPHYPEDFYNLTSLTRVANVLGSIKDIQQLSKSLETKNISLILDLPIRGHVKEIGKILTPRVSAVLDAALNGLNQTKSIDVEVDATTTPSPVEISENVISEALKFWIDHGVNGFYIKGLEDFAIDPHLTANLADWKRILGPNRPLIVSEEFISSLQQTDRFTAMKYIDLVDVFLDVHKGTTNLEKRLSAVLNGDLAVKESGSWIHWSIGGVDKHRLTARIKNSNATLAATVMSLMLPGTPNIFYGDEIALDTISDAHKEHSESYNLHHLPTMKYFNDSTQFTSPETLPWLPHTASFNFKHFKTIAKMIKLRDRSPAIYKNAVCKTETTLTNTQILRSHDDILVIERFYPRRNTFVSVSNLGNKNAKLDMGSMYYSGIEMLRENAAAGGGGEKIFFKNVEVDSLETIVVKLDK